MQSIPFPQKRSEKPLAREYSSLRTKCRCEPTVPALTTLTPALSFMSPPIRGMTGPTCACITQHTAGMHVSSSHLRQRLERCRFGSLGAGGRTSWQWRSCRRGPPLGRHLAALLAHRPPRHPLSRSSQAQGCRQHLAPPPQPSRGRRYLAQMQAMQGLMIGASGSLQRRPRSVRQPWRWTQQPLSATSKSNRCFR